ncbi:hypothetical protein ACER0C_023689 [Sarotherodon galilaeus]
MDPADLELYKQWEVAFTQLEEELRWKPLCTPEYEHVFRGTRPALGRPWSCRVRPPAPRPRPLQAGVLRFAPCPHSADLALPYCALEAKLPGLPASCSRTKRCSRRHTQWSLSNSRWTAAAQLSPAPVSVPRVRGARAQLVPALVPRLAEALIVPAPVPTPQVGTADAQPLPVPVPAMNQLPPAPISTPRVGVAGVRSAPAPMPVPRVRPARTPLTSAPIPTPWVGATSVQQVPALLPWGLIRAAPALPCVRWGLWGVLPAISSTYKQPDGCHPVIWSCLV